MDADPDTDAPRDRGFSHPTWLTAGGTLVAYGAILLALFAVLFLLPYAIFALS